MIWMVVPKILQEWTASSLLIKFTVLCVLCSVVGWDHITEGLVQLGFALMESYGPKTCFGKVSDASVINSQRRLTPAQEACQLGVRILQDTFRVHESSRAAIIERLLNLVITRASSSVSHYIGQSVFCVRVTENLMEAVRKWWTVEAIRRPEKHSCDVMSVIGY